MLNLKVKEKITIFKINAMAMTSEYKVHFHSETERTIFFKEPRKRKVQGISKQEIVVFRSWDFDIQCDSESCSVMRGNACFNFVTKMSNKEVRKYLEKNCLTALTDSMKGSMINLTSEQGNNAEYNETKENVLYPEFSQGHGVVINALNR